MKNVNGLEVLRMTNKQAIAYIDSIMTNYDSRVIYKSKDNPRVHLCEVWLSENDMIALQMAKEALREKADVT